MPDDPGTEVALRNGPWVPQGRAAAALGNADPGEKVSAEAEEMYWEGVPENTQKIYTYQWKRYLKWCGLNDRDPLAAGASDAEHRRAVATIREFIAAHWTMTRADGSTLCGQNGQPYSPRTIETALAPISIAHQRRGLSSPTQHPDVARQLRGYRRRYAKAGFQPAVAHALTFDEILRMCRTQDVNSTVGLRNATMMRLAVDMASRNSELVAVDLSHLKWQSATRLRLFVPSSKNDPDAVGAWVGIEADLDDEPEWDTILLIRQLIEVNARFGFTAGALFRQGAVGNPRADGSFYGTLTAERMTKEAWAKVVDRAAAKSGVDRDPVTGEERKVVPHSFRAAFATAGFEANMDQASVAEGGRWSKDSNVPARYKRSADLFKHNVMNAVRAKHKAEKEAAALREGGQG